MDRPLADFHTENGLISYPRRKKRSCERPVGARYTTGEQIATKTGIYFAVGDTSVGFTPCSTQPQRPGGALRSPTPIRGGRAHFPAGPCDPEKVLGPKHPDVATSLNNLGWLLGATNRLAEAEPLFRRALAIDEKSFGPEHPDVARDLNNLAGLLSDTTGRLRPSRFSGKCCESSLSLGIARGTSIHTSAQPSITTPDGFQRWAWSGRNCGTRALGDRGRAGEVGLRPSQRRGPEVTETYTDFFTASAQETRSRRGEGASEISTKCSILSIVLREKRHFWRGALRGRGDTA